MCVECVYEREIERERERERCPGHLGMSGDSPTCLIIHRENKETVLPGEMPLCFRRNSGP